MTAAVAVAAVAWFLPEPAAFGQCTISFASQVKYTSGLSQPNCIALGDFDGDGDLDLAITADNSLGVAILKGNGDGTFAAAHIWSLFYASYSVAVGDLNGDGKLDLAVATTGLNWGFVYVTLGNGDGTFGPAVGYAVGYDPTSVAIGDLNSDGKPDLVVANATDDNVSVLLGNGDGTFGPQVTYGTGNKPYSVAIGDLNGDGKPDLAVANGLSNNVSVLLGNGDGTFAPRVNYATGSACNSVSIGDLDGDGKPDLVSANGGGNNVSVLLGNGDGTFAAAANYAAGTAPVSVAIGDLNGDGIPDLAVANAGGNNVSLLAGNGDGSFAAPINKAVDADPRVLAMGDLNGDGLPDVAVPSYSTDKASVLLNTTPAAVILQQPLDQTVCSGGSATFTVGANTAALAYQWRRGNGNAVNNGTLTNGTVVSGATTATLTLSSINDLDVANHYKVDVSGSCNLVTSHSAPLNVDSTPAINTGPSNQTACANGAASLSVAATGGDLVYGWRRGNGNLVNNGTLTHGTVVSGATTSTITFSSIHATDLTGSFYAVVSNVCDSMQTTTASITVFSGGSGDGNGSGSANGADVQGFVNALIQGGSPSAAYCAYDMNGDGVVTLGDVSGFVTKLLSP